MYERIGEGFNRRTVFIMLLMTDSLILSPAMPSAMPGATKPAEVSAKRARFGGPDRGLCHLAPIMPRRMIDTAFDGSCRMLSA